MEQGLAKSELPAIVRTSREMWLVFGGIFGGVFLLSLTVNVIKLWDVRSGAGLWVLSGGSGSMFAFVVYVLRSTKLVLANEMIHYRSAFIVKRVLLKNVVKADIEIGSKTWSYQPMTRLVVVVQDEEKRNDIVINLGYFHLRECGKWLDALKEQLAKRI